MIALLLAALARGETIQRVVLETPAGARQPQFAVARARIGETPGIGIEQLVDSVYVVYGTPNTVHVCISKDSGASFEPAWKVGAVGSLALGMRRGPRIAIVGQSIVITAIAGEKGGGRDEDVVSWHSTDQGGSWTYDGRIHEVAGAAREGLHALAAGPKDELFCVWIDLAKDAPRICGASSAGDRLGRWSETRIVFADPDGICPCCHPSVAFDAKGRLYVMWRGHDGASRDMVVATSDDLGKTFSRPTKLGTGTWKLEACPMDGGALQVSGGRLRSVWRRESEIFRAELAGPERKLGAGEQPSLALGQDGEYFAWLERRGGSLMLLRPGEKDPIRIDEHANDPVLVSGPRGGAPVLAAWESGSGDATRIVVARLDGPAAKKQ